MSHTPRVVPISGDPSDGGLVDVGRLLDQGIDDGPHTVMLTRDDGTALFYPSAVNVVYGPPESGKTWLALAAIQEVSKAQRRSALVDMDHNGAPALVGNLLALGISPNYLRDTDYFRLYEPDDEIDVLTVVDNLVAWRPAMAVVDSIGELLPMFRASSNSPDDFTAANRATLVPIAKAGAAVIAIDHIPKATESVGPTGTAAKTRAVSGVSISVALREQFIPGRGGAAGLTIHKDRHGYLRRRCPSAAGGKGQMAGIFTLTPGARGSVLWNVKAPDMGEEAPGVRLSQDGEAVEWLQHHGVGAADSIQAAQRAWDEHRPEFSRAHLRRIQKDRQQGLL